VDLIPVFSYVWLRGRCRHCQASLPKRLVMVEVATGVMLGVLYLVFGLEAELGVATFWGCLFIVIFVIDLEQCLILNKVVYPSLGIALLFAGLVDRLHAVGVFAQQEAGELARARTPDEVVAEAADVMYFALVALVKAGVRLEAVEAELDRRSLKVSRRAGDGKPAREDAK
jgi:phosphoribosyl-ATP pyrophosphohydrolase